MDWTYLQVALRAKQQGALVVGCVNNQWRGTLKQQIGIRVAPVVLRTAIPAHDRTFLYDPYGKVSTEII
jgi:hypothetical protein